MFSTAEIVMTILLILSLGANIVLFLFVRKSLMPLLLASETASSIFTHLDSYREHLASIYELKDFYGDPSIKRMIEHTTDLIEYLKQFESVYSLTQPGLEEFLLEESDKIDNFEMSEEGNEAKEEE